MITNSKIGLTLFGLLVVIVCAYIVVTQEQQVVYEDHERVEVMDTKPNMVAASSTPVKTMYVPGGVKTPSEYELKSVDVFGDPVRDSHVSNVVGYFARGAFVVSVPDWIVAYWGNGPFEDDFGSLSFTPRYEVKDRDFSDINMYVRPTDELFNAEWLYSKDKDKATATEEYMNARKDMKVYFLKDVQATRTYLTFYIDGNNKTGKVTFDASNESMPTYLPKIKEFVSSLGTGKEVMFDK